MEDKHTTAKHNPTKQENIEGALRSLESAIDRLEEVRERVRHGDDVREKTVQDTSGSEQPYAWGMPLSEFLDTLPTHLNAYEEKIRLITDRIDESLF